MKSPLATMTTQTSPPVLRATMRAPVISRKHPGSVWPRGQTSQLGGAGAATKLDWVSRDNPLPHLTPPQCDRSPAQGWNPPAGTKKTTPGSWGSWEVVWVLTHHPSCSSITRAPGPQLPRYGPAINGTWVGAVLRTRLPSTYYGSGNGGLVMVLIIIFVLFLL